ncbi:MAG: 2Fe-2S iron-sulfur cluster-binding protein, partial [bacterium]
MKIKVNGKEYFVNEHLTILEFLKKIGIYIPSLCYHPNLRPVGSCRVCVIKDRGKYKNSCATYVEDGMEIETHSSGLIEIR